MSTNDSTARQQPTEYLKVTVVGDGNTGKTCMVVAFCEDTFIMNYEMTVFDNRKEKITVDGVDRLLDLWDTAGQEIYAALRRLAYPLTKVFLLCFSVDYRPSFENIPEEWLQELRTASPNAKIVLVGTKIDLRREEKSRRDPAEEDSPFVSTEEGRQLMRRIGAVSYVECSAKTREGIQEVFQEAVRAVYGTPSRFSFEQGCWKRCHLL